jgi:hypothetical protein
LKVGHRLPGAHPEVLVVIKARILVFLLLSLKHLELKHSFVDLTLDATYQERCVGVNTGQRLSFPLIQKHLLLFVLSTQEVDRLIFQET